MGQFCKSNGFKLIVLQAGGSNDKGNRQSRERYSSNVALVIIAHIYSVTRVVAPNEKETSPFDDISSHDQDILSLIVDFKKKFHNISVLLPHTYQDTVSGVCFDFRLNRNALDRVFAFRSCQSMKHLDLWDESTLPPDDDVAIEAEEKSHENSNDTDAILERSLVMSKPKVKE
jgi:hypothetical protein